MTASGPSWIVRGERFALDRSWLVALNRHVVTRLGLADAGPELFRTLSSELPPYDNLRHLDLLLPGSGPGSSEPLHPLRLGCTRLTLEHQAGAARPASEEPAAVDVGDHPGPRRVDLRVRERERHGTRDAQAWLADWTHWWGTGGGRSVPILTVHLVGQYGWLVALLLGRGTRPAWPDPHEGVDRRLTRIDLDVVGYRTGTGDPDRRALTAVRLMQAVLHRLGRAPWDRAQIRFWEVREGLDTVETLTPRLDVGGDEPGQTLELDDEVLTRALASDGVAAEPAAEIRARLAAGAISLYVVHL